MEINVPQDAITSLVDKLSEKVFTKDNGDIRDGPFKVHFNKKISRRLREIAFHGLLSKLDAESGFEEDQKFNSKERLSIVGYKLKAYGLAGKAHHLEKLVSTLGQLRQYTCRWVNFAYVFSHFWQAKILLRIWCIVFCINIYCSQSLTLLPARNETKFTLVLYITSKFCIKSSMREAREYMGSCTIRNSKTEFDVLREGSLSAGT